MKKNNLIFETISIKENQYLSEILNPLPSNTIIHKTLPGLGATFGEIYSKRNSIIIEPNVPVIKGKEEKHKAEQKKKPKLRDILGIYKGINVTDIVDYIKSDVTYKKIITTPESFYKIKRAMNEVGIDMYKDYFLLFDECERIIQDVRYRSNIAAPINDFFLFVNKAFVSATPLRLSDPRFASQNFKGIKVQPQFAYKHDLEIIHTNNVIAQLRKCLEKNPKEHYCFFLNSTRTIRAIIENLGIEKNSLVHCAKDSVDKLKARNESISTTENFAKDRLVKYNFFTSRFFSGLDMELDYKPFVVIITDIYFAEHSIIDPETEAIQIFGRFRNGIQKRTHIINTNSKLMAMSEPEAIIYLKGCEKVYREFISLAASVTNLGAKNTIKQALERVEFANYISDGKINHFMCDNFLEEERVKGYYKNIDNLISAYLTLPHFNVQLIKNIFPLGDIDRLRRSRMESLGKKQLCIEVANQLEKIYANRLPYTIDNMEVIKEELRKVCPFVVIAYEKIGYQGLKDANFNEAEIKKAEIKQRIKEGRESFTMIDLVYDKFKVGNTYSEESIRKYLSEVYIDLKIEKSAAASHIDYYFETGRNTYKQKKGYVLRSRKFRTQEEINSSKTYNSRTK